MRRILITITLIATSLIALPSPVLQSSHATKRNLRIDVKYDKKKGVTTLVLQPLTIWRGGFGQTIGSRMMLSVGFQYPKRTIVKPQEVALYFLGMSGEGWNPFPTANLAALVDGTHLDLGEFKAGPGAMIRTTPLGGASGEGRTHKVSYENFSKIASAKELTLVIGDLKYDIEDEHLQALRDFHELMQQEGRELK